MSVLDQVFQKHFVKGKHCECDPGMCDCGGLIHYTGGTRNPVSYDPIHYTICRCDSCGKEIDHDSPYFGKG